LLNGIFELAVTNLRQQLWQHMLPPGKKQKFGPFFEMRVVREEESKPPIPQADDVRSDIFPMGAPGKSVTQFLTCFKVSVWHIGDGERLRGSALLPHKVAISCARTSG
jgi:hypothetical protein